MILLLIAVSTIKSVSLFFFSNIVNFITIFAFICYLINVVLDTIIEFIFIKVSKKILNFKKK